MFNINFSEYDMSHCNGGVWCGTLQKGNIMAHAPNKIITQLKDIETKFELIKTAFASSSLSRKVNPKHGFSAINLLQYLYLRGKNISRMQKELHSLGLSSLASAESHIHRQLQETLLRLGQTFKKKQLNPCTVPKANEILFENTRNLFGDPPKDTGICIMVTMDSGMHKDIRILENLLQRGMRIARINCAHDNEETWGALIAGIQQASKATGIPCRIYMDLAGPKFRIKTCNRYKEVDKIKIATGDTLLMFEKNDGTLPRAKSLYCQIPGITSVLGKGDIIMIDDGIIEAMVSAQNMLGVELTITRVSGKHFLKSGKGINFPQNTIPIQSLTKEDIASLDFVKKHADMVGFSFVKTAADLAYLDKHLYHPGNNKSPDLIIKIETPESVVNLPELLLYAMRYGNFGVMIARGDLAVEIGFERMSEIQEEIMWLCEAAHTPVIYATQVLEQLNKTGIASRSEITDAYKATQAECVMVNKGAYTHLVLDTLIDISKRSHRHNKKKRYEMQSLGIAKKFNFKNMGIRMTNH
jgi:pyruvate kinase